MTLETQSYDQLVSAQVAAIQAASTKLLDFQTGSVLLSLVESNAAAVGLWLQALYIQLLATTRASTSTGASLDTWMADFNFSRLPATFATGNVTFSRFTNTQQALILIGTQVETADGAEIFTVIIDTSNPNYNASLGGYVLNGGTSSIDVPVQANTAGTGGNVSAGAINTLASSIPYVDTVTNAFAFTNALEEETDDAFRARFVLYINTLSRATEAAIGYAITSFQQGITYSLTENEDYDGTPDRGNFYAVVDDGSHAPSDQFVTNVGANVEAYRGFCISWGIFKPVTTTANVSMTITTASGYTHSAIVAIVVSALNTYLSSFTIGVDLPYTRLEQIAYDASPAVINVTSVLLNSGTSDLTVDQKHVIIPGTISVT